MKKKYILFAILILVAICSFISFLFPTELKIDFSYTTNMEILNYENNLSVTLDVEQTDILADKLDDIDANRIYSLKVSNEWDYCIKLLFGSSENARIYVSDNNIVKYNDKFYRILNKGIDIEYIKSLFE